MRLVEHRHINARDQSAILSLGSYIEILSLCQHLSTRAIRGRPFQKYKGDSAFLLIDFGNREKFFCLQAGAADKGPIDIENCQ
jgi:hypothetical protein